ncbi:MAG: hypothetical protein VB108_01370 [Anaerolineaceae bacterium]|nr:hypothetical protein [Anaerolineaceae bacterium]
MKKIGWSLLCGILFAGVLFSAVIAQPIQNQIYLPIVMKAVDPTPTPPPTPTITPIVIIPTLPTPDPTCGHDWDCSDFGTAAHMWEILRQCNYNLQLDPWDLDRNHDGQPCEALP